MAHLVESMAYVGQTPWHGLGNALTPKQSIDVWAHQAGMNWEILQTPVCYAPDPADMPFQFDERCVLYRSDNLAPLSVVSQRYQIVQPREILAFYRDLTERSGFELETAGVLKGGRKLWALARTGQSTALKGNDVTKGYVLLATACDGTMATTAQFTSVRVVCNNTLAIATADHSGAVKVPHSTRFDAQAVKRQLGISVSAWDDFMYRLKHLSERKVKPREAEAFMQQVFNGKVQDGAAGDARQDDAPALPNARAMVTTLSLFHGNGMGSQLASSDGTAYGLLNAVTEFVDHQRRARSRDHRLDSAWFGQGAALKDRALQEAMALVA